MEVADQTPPFHEGEAEGLKKEADSGVLCLVLLAKFHGLSADLDQLFHERGTISGNFSDKDLLLAAKRMGLLARKRRIAMARLMHQSLPAMALMNSGTWVILARCEPSKVLLHNPLIGRPEAIGFADFEKCWTGELILVQSRASLVGEMAKFDFSWFIPAVVKYRKLFAEVLIFSFVLQLIALVTPLFFQVVMDKVLVHRTIQTLEVIAIGLLASSSFEVVLVTLRTFLFSHTSSRIDVELGAKLFRHLLSLPLSYFQARRAGDSVARIRELENIRSFLTGNALTIVMDLVFSVVFLSVMFFYSAKLALIVVGSLPLYAGISSAVTPLLRRRLQAKFQASAENQAFLVETINGIDTLKAMAVEPDWTRTWDGQLSNYVAAGMKTTTLAALTNGGITFIGKLVTVGTLWFGAQAVINGELSVGQLIAFNMLAGQVAAPVLRLAQLWTDFQQVGISVERLGDILNTRGEISSRRPSLPRISGNIYFEKISFRYSPDGPLVLRSIDLNIRSGEIIGIVGRSGSGKSTLTRLIQRMFVPESGRIFVDGIDLSLVDATSLRRQIGVVLQENVLFHRSIRENIALADPGTSLDKIVQAAKLAGAHEFISAMKDGYDTLVGEHGSTLSGGQRQRIAIARALLSDPRILIFDEATSALDYESERTIQNNMREICVGRTVLIIAHRLSAVREANRILVVEKGEIIEQGSHSELLSNSVGLYRHLYELQS